MLVGEWVVRFGDGSALALSVTKIYFEFQSAGRFHNYEEDPRDG
jgi:hypothetical protein